MEILINGICYKVFIDVFYRLGFLRYTNLFVYIFDFSKCFSDVEEDSWEGNVVQE